MVFSNGVGPDDDEVRTGNAMVFDCYGRLLAETCKAGAVSRHRRPGTPGSREHCTGVRWIKARRPDLYLPLAVSTGAERDTRSVRFEYGGE